MFICGPCAVFQERWLNDSTRLPLVLSEQFVAEILGDLPVGSTTSFVAVRRQDPASFTTPKRRCVAVATRRHKVVRKVIRILVGRMSPMPLSGISAVLRASVRRHRSTEQPIGRVGQSDRRAQDLGVKPASVNAGASPPDVRRFGRSASRPRSRRRRARCGTGGRSHVGRSGRFDYQRQRGGLGARLK
jgi:hypothetical protein